MNNIIIVGRVINDIELIETSKGKYYTFTIATNRYFKNSDGIYESDFTDIRVSYSLYANLIDICKRGDLVGIRGMLFSDKVEINDTIQRINYIYSDKITILSCNNKKNEVQNEENE